MPQQPATSFADDLAAVRGQGGDAFEADLAAVRGGPSLTSQVLGAVSKLAHIPGVTETPAWMRKEAAKQADEITTPRIGESRLGAMAKGFYGGSLQGATELMNLFDVGASLAPEGKLGSLVNALLTARGAGNMAEGVNKGDVGQGARGVMETALSLLGFKNGPHTVQGEVVPGAPRPNLPALPAETVDAVSTARVPEHYPAPTPVVRPALPPARVPIITPPPADTSFVRGVPARYPEVEKVIAQVRAAQPPSPGFAEPPIVPRPAAAPAPVPNIVEAIQGSMATPSTAADRVVQMIKQNAITAAAKAPEPPVRAADVILDDRLVGGARSVEAPPEPGRLTLPAPKNNSDQAYNAARAAQGIKPSPAEVAERPAASQTAQDVATLKGRSTLQDRLPPEFQPTVEQMDTLDTLGNAYRKASAQHDAAKIDYASGKITADQLQAAKITHRQAGKSLRQMEVQVQKEAKAALDELAGKKKAGGDGSTLYAGIPLQMAAQYPQLTQAIAGGTIGALTGSSLDEDHPIRGALIGAAAGAVAPGTVIGTAKSIKIEGLRAVGKLYVSGLLSGPMTSVRNTTANAANGLFRFAAHPAVALIDRVTSKGGPRSAVLNDITPAMIATWSGFKRGATDALKTFLTGDSPYGRLAADVQNTTNATELAGGLGNAVNWPGRALDALDVWVGRMIEDQTIASRAYVNAFNKGVPLAQRWKMVGTLQANPTPELQAAGAFEAKRALFRGDPGELTQRFTELRKTLNDLPGKLPIGDFIIPFVRVPAQIAKQAAEMTPLGLLQSTAGLDRRATLEHYGRVLTGSLIMAKGAQLAVEGRLSGSGPSNPQDRAKLYETGWRPYSINVSALPGPIALAFGGSKAEDGSFWIPNQALGPAGMLMGAVGDIAEGWRDGQNRDNATIEKTIEETLARGLHTLTDQTFLSDAVDLGEALDNPAAAPRYFQRKIGSLVPAGVRAVARMQDTTVRDPQSAIEAIKASLPGLSQTVPARTDRFGDEIRRPQGTEFVPPNPAAAVLNAAGANLNKSAGRISVTEPQLRQVLEGAGFKFDDSGVIDLSPGEKRALQNKRGQQIASIVASLKNSDMYNSLPPKAQKIVIDRIKRKVETDRRMPELLQLLKDRQAAAAPK